MKEWSFEATKDRIPWLTDQVNEILESLDCSMKAQMQIDVAIDELMANIASYAYAPGTGDVKVCFDYEADSRTVSITFIDSGIPYDPLKKPDPDVTLNAVERAVGGLGVFLVKKTMDDIRYVYQDGHNQLTILKRI